MPGGAPRRRFQPRGHGAEAGQRLQAEHPANEWGDVADGAWEPEQGEHQHDGGVASSYFGTNDAAAASTSPTAGGLQAEGGAATSPAETLGAQANAMPPGCGFPNAPNPMSPMQPIWFGRPSTSWSSTGLHGADWCSTSTRWATSTGHFARGWHLASTEPCDDAWRTSPTSLCRHGSGWQWHSISTWNGSARDVDDEAATTCRPTTSRSHEQCL